MTTLSTHVLDTSLGCPAAGVKVTLSRDDAVVGEGTTDTDGRVRDFVGSDMAIAAGTYRLSFVVGDYFATTEREAFYDEIVISFRIDAASDHYHVPLLLSPFGYSTYRGS